MKILDLMEAEFETRRNINKSRNTFRKTLDRPNEKHTEKAGAFGRVYSTGDPHTLIKRPHAAINPKSDGYYQYASLVIRHKLAQSNPYFPRFYDIREFKDKKGKILYRAEIEKLHRHDQIEKDILKSLIENIFEFEDYEYFEYDMQHMPGTVIPALLQSFLMDGRGSSKDAKLNEAIKIISTFADDNYRGYDVHTDNIMYRLSPYPQIVIVDPVI